MDMESHFIQLGDARIHYRTYGIGRPVVLAHGFLESSEMWSNFIKNAPQNFQFILPDLPGHGASDIWDHKHTMDMMAGLVERILSHRKIDEKVLWIGHSMGGYVGLAFAEIFPEKIDGLCLFHSQAHPDSDEKKRDRLRAVEALRLGREKFITESIQNLFAPYNRDRLSDEIRGAAKIAETMPTEGITAALLGMRERANRVELFKSMSKSMTIIGLDDPVIPAERELQLYKNSNVKIKPLSCGHMGHLEQPTEAYSALRSFLSGV